MTSNLQNPIFTDETKAHEWLEARVLKVGSHGRVPLLNLILRVAVALSRL